MQRQNIPKSGEKSYLNQQGEIRKNDVGNHASADDCSSCGDGAVLKQVGIICMHPHTKIGESMGGQVLCPLPERLKELVV